MAIVSLFFPCKGEEVNPEEWNTNYPYVFVHGLMGWGSYDPQYKIMPYWGMFGGELLGKLEKKGYDCYAASAPSSAPSKNFDSSAIEKGIWQIMPVYQGDHMSLQGGMMRVNTDVADYYTIHFDMINKLS